MLYSIFFRIYVLGVFIAALFNKKARLLIKGHRMIFSTLKEKVDQQARYIWFHASSLGEFEQGRPLIERIWKNHPEYKILLTFYSPSGYEVRKNYSFADIVCYLPFDTKTSIRRFLKKVPIERAFFIKYEFWPNTLRCLKRRGIPVYSVSSVFRKEQLFFKWYGKLYSKSLRYFDHFFVQNEHSRELLESINIKNVTVVGDTRCDRVMEVAAESKTIPVLECFTKDAKVFIAGSSWLPDEEIYLPYFNGQTTWKIIIAPHVIDENRLVDIEKRMAGKKIARLSNTNIENAVDLDCLIIDCYGLLASAYRYCDIAYVGGGFGAGIHNLLEAAVFSIPVLFGPKHGRFREAASLISLGGGFEVTDTYSFQIIMDKFFSAPAYLTSAGEAAGSYFKENSCASEYILNQIRL